MTTFIIPSIGRDTLPRTIQSLKNQTDPDFKAIIIFDGISPTYSSNDTRISVMQTEQKLGTHVGASFSGSVRNQAIPHVDTPWISFVDDDDTVSPHYVENLKKLSGDNDFIIFRMLHHGGLVMPPYGSNDIVVGLVGISFSVKKEALYSRNLMFPNNGVEDFELLTALKSTGAKYCVSPDVMYFCRK